MGESDEATANHDEDVEDYAEDYPEDDTPADTIEPPAAGFILEPANARLTSIDGWELVDEWYWEPISFDPSDCDLLNEVLLLEDWGVITSFWLQDGTELFHFTAELNTADKVAAYVEAFESVAEQCPQVTFGDASVTLRSFESGGFEGFTLTADSQVRANWFYEQGTASAVIMSRNNVVSILQVAPGSDGFDMAEFDAIVQSASDRLAGVVPEVAASFDN